MEQRQTKQLSRPQQKEDGAESVDSLVSPLGRSSIEEHVQSVDHLQAGLERLPQGGIDVVLLDLFLLNLFHVILCTKDKEKAVVRMNWLTIMTVTTLL